MGVPECSHSHRPPPPLYTFTYATREMNNNSPPCLDRKFKAGKLISLNPATKKTSPFSHQFYLQCPLTSHWHAIINHLLIALLTNIHFFHVLLPPLLPLSLSLCSESSVSCCDDHIRAPFSGARLFSAALNSKANELPNKAHIGNSMSPVGPVVYSNMITARQRAWGGDWGFNNHAPYGPRVAFKFSMQICRMLNYKTLSGNSAMSGSSTCSGRHCKMNRGKCAGITPRAGSIKI